MAHKQLLLSFLVNILGEFVNGLTEENLKVGVWGGKIKLKNLEINRSGLEKMNLPLTVKEGYLDTLEIKIPWTNLDKQAVQITITGVHLLVGPVDFSLLTVDSAAARCREKQKEQLEKAERVIEFSAANYIDADPNNSGDLKNSSYKRKIMRKMAKNLEVSFHNIHIRYEDGSTLSNESFNFGMTMDSFAFKSSNQQWNDASAEVKNTDSILSQMSFKLVTIRNVGVYWNVETSTADSESSLSSKVSGCKDWRYIIQPVNQLEAKISLNYAKNVDPQTSVSIDDLDLSLQLDKYQLHQAVLVQKCVMKANAKLYIVRHRPRQSALEKPMYWWKYVIMLLTNNAKVFTKNIDTAMLCCKYRKRYIEILVKGKTIDAKTGKLFDLVGQEEAEIDIIEELLPIDALVIFRQIATKEAFICNQQNQKEKVVSAKKRPPKRFSFFKSFKNVSPVASTAAGAGASDTAANGGADSSMASSSSSPVSSVTVVVGEEPKGEGREEEKDEEGKKDDSACVIGDDHDADIERVSDIVGCIYVRVVVMAICCIV
jgi:vacuolar protein sorting-associated protein 13A/C